MTQRIGRRQFLTQAAAGTVALTAFSYGRVLGANGRVPLGIIGSGGRGRALIKEFLKNPDSEFVAVCDVYETNRDAGVTAAAGGKPKPYGDHRKLLDDRDVKAVIIATPDHWHHDQLQDALKAGKDVYLEKPMSHSVDQGADMVKAVRATDRVVQVGMQRRSSPIIREVRRLIQAGDLGDVALARAAWYWNMKPLAKDRPLKGKLDWDTFCGPAGKQELTRDGYENVAFLNWRYFWAFSGGNCTDQGTHLMDVVQWCLNDGRPPRSAVQQGQVHRLQPSQTPDVFCCAFEYPKFLATWTLDYTDSFKDSWEIIFQGNKASLVLDDDGFRLYEDPGKGKKPKPPARVEKGKLLTTPHVDNFLECLRTRKDPNAPVEVGHQAVTGPHLANYALRHHCRAVLGEDGKVTAG